MTEAGEIDLGATPLPGGRCRFRLWAPAAEVVELHLLEPGERVLRMEPVPRGYHHAVVDGVRPGQRYLFRLPGGAERPDPASRFQPRGVHGPSQVVDPAFEWDDADWTGVGLRDLVLYELHVGVYTSAGTFDGILAHLAALKELGVTAVEIMPVAQFPGSRNWGYDGAGLWAVQDSYGGPGGLRRLARACHRQGLGLFLDVVYNHLGPEGNYLAEFGPYFTPAYRTPWGEAVNFDGPHSDEVRRFFIQNALHWYREYHLDGLRLDALHAILDRSARPFLEQLSEAVDAESERLGRTLLLVGESDSNDARLVHPRHSAGIGLSAVWSDDFHHALHARLTGERTGYYEDFGPLDHIARAFSQGFVYCGQYSAYRKRSHGRPAGDVAPERLVVFSQNHDQVGNRLRGDRLASLVPFEALKLAAAAVLLSPYVPLLFMGEEHGETAPFLYFTSHSDSVLVEAVREGRRREFAAFGWTEAPPDPQDERTFRRSMPEHGAGAAGGERRCTLRSFYRELLRVRREHPALASPKREDAVAEVVQDLDVVALRRRHGSEQALAVLHFGTAAAEGRVPLPPGKWRKDLDSADPRWGGGGTAIPDEVVSSGMLSVRVAPYHVVLLSGARES